MSEQLSERKKAAILAEARKIHDNRNIKGVPYGVEHIQTNGKCPICKVHTACTCGVCHCTGERYDQDNDFTGDYSTEESLRTTPLITVEPEAA